MKAVIVLFALCAFLASSVQSQSQSKKIPAQETAKASHVKVAYTCPMHPDVTSSKPGICPKCKMDLVKKDKKKPATAAADDKSSTKAPDAYACPMHPDVTSNAPGTCPKCKLALVKKKSS